MGQKGTNPKTSNELLDYIVAHSKDSEESQSAIRTFLMMYEEKKMLEAARKRREVREIWAEGLGGWKEKIK